VRPGTWIILIVFAFPSFPVTAASAPEHRCGAADMNQRGDHVMGFDHTRTTHHFRLLPDGGAIEVTVNDPADSENRTMIQSHLSHIARMFAEEDFQAPMLIHGTQPPGADVMTQLKSEITYRFEPLQTGGRVRITTKNAQALEAIHAFLKFQIREHETGDPLEVGGAPPASKKEAPPKSGGA